MHLDLDKIGTKALKFEESAAQISILVITLVAYLLTKSPIFGVLVAIEFVSFVALEIYHGVKDHGVKHEIVDTLKSLGIALGIWFAISFVLKTAVPISAVVSCSMLPNLQRGDLAIIRGVTAAELAAPEISVTFEEFKEIRGPAAEVLSPYRNFTVNGSVFSYCIAYRFSDHLCRQFYNSPDLFMEKRGPLLFAYEKCARKNLGNGAVSSEPCITAVYFRGREIRANHSNSIIVYEPPKGDLFSRTGDIIHRVYLRIDVEGRKYVLAKGDNNNVFDIQFYDYATRLANTPVPEKNIKGAFLFPLPYVGYFKLFISGFVQEPMYCNTNLVYRAA